MAKATIIGAGLMGSAMAWPLSDNGHRVSLVGTHLDDEIIASCRQSRFHPRLGRGLPAGVEAFHFSAIEEACAGSDILVSGVNSNGVGWMADTLGRLVKPGQKVICVTKGLHVSEEGQVRIFPSLIADKFPAAARGRVPVAAIGGPCIAGELAGRRQTCVVFGCEDPGAAAELARAFRTSYYHVWPSSELLSLEIGVALKNAYTLGVGFAYGLLEKQGGPDDAGASMHNLASAIFAQGVHEMGGLIADLGGKSEFAGVLPGAGDLYVTSMGGRTVRLGRLLGQGKSYGEARELMKGETLESVEIVKAMGRLLPQLGRGAGGAKADYPLMRMLISVVGGKAFESMPLEKFFGGVFSVQE